MGIAIELRYQRGDFTLRVEAEFPAEVQWRRDKVPFPMPWEWFSGPLFRKTREVIMEGPLLRDGYLRRARLEKLLREHQTRRGDLSTDIWKWLCLTTWLTGHTELTNTAQRAPNCRLP